MKDTKFAETHNISLENFEEYIKGLLEENHDYCSAPDAVAKAGLAAMYLMSNKLGITGFQASYALWDVIKEWQYSDNKTGLRLVNYDDLLYPQYADKMTSISADVWAKLQEEAANKLGSHKDAHPRVLAHWQSIVDGNVPFGLKVGSE